MTLQCRYIRGAFDDKPYTIGKYEHTRIRTAIAELAANGGLEAEAFPFMTFRETTLASGVRARVCRIGSSQGFLGSTFDFTGCRIDGR